MKKIYMAIAALMVAGAGFAQTDTTKSKMDTTSYSRIDTVKVGNFIIIKKNRGSGETRKTTDVTVERKPYKPTKLSTNWFIFDLGFANLNDQTNYANAGDYLRNINNKGLPGKEDLKLRASKSSNVNIWLVMQKLNLAKGYVNLKYGVGLEMFNFRYESNVNYSKGPAYIFKDSLSFSKNKLYAGYVTVPLMLNVNLSPGKKGFSFSAGISAGYLVGSHDKQISGERGKEKTKGDLGLEQFRVAYIGELGLGPVRLFGSYSLTKLHDRGLEQYPYSFGIRFSNW
jgi:hypothetical protein